MSADGSADLAVEAVGLVKQYGGVRAVDGLDLRVPVGGVHGLLGPNGSGKTTTIRMALGLSRPDGGRLRVLGEDVRPGRAEVVRRVGATVEQPRFFPGFSGRHSLRLLAMSIGVPASRVEEVIAEVGLTGHEGSTVAGYSLGMKQRLAVAAALLKRPDLLVLDEPTNGLDPAGIQQIRLLVRAMADQGVTVLVSSHILAEVEQMVDTVSIISRGRLLAEGRLSDLLAGADYCVVVRIADAPEAAAVLRDPWHVTLTGPDSFEVRGVPAGPAPEPGQINQTLAGHGWYAHELWSHSESLEQVFLRLTNPVAGHPDGGWAA